MIVAMEWSEVQYREGVEAGRGIYR